MNVVADRAVRIRLSVANRQVINLVITNAADQALLQHWPEVISERIVVAHVVIFGSDVMP